MQPVGGKVSKRRSSGLKQGPLTGADLVAEIERFERSGKKSRSDKNCYNECVRKMFGKFMHWWRHPIVRLGAPTYIMISDLLIHAADPVDHSDIEYMMPYAGEAWNLLNPFNGQPLPAWGHLVKMLLAAVSVYIGLRIPRMLRKSMTRVRLFRRGRGAFLLPLVFMMIMSVIAAQIWNAFLRVALKVPRPKDGFFYEQPETIYFTSGFGASFGTSANIIDSFVFVLDFGSVFLVVDMVLQDGSQYPDFGKFKFRSMDIDLRKLWTETWDGSFRIVITWTTFLLSFIIAMFYTWIRSRKIMVKTEEKDDGLKQLWAYMVEHHEFERALLYASQFFFDSLVVQQDWEYPTFENQLQITLVGTNIAFEGRFANYFLMVAVMMVDLKCLVSTLFYHPEKIAQYTDKTGYVWAVTNMTLIHQTDASNLTFGNFQSRVDEGCFRQLSLQELQGLYCFKDLSLPGDFNASVKDPVSGVYMAGGHNACCDARTRTLWLGHTFIGPDAFKNIAFCLLPLLASISLALILARLIARSRREMCRRVILCHVLSKQFHQHVGNGNLVVNKSFVQMRRLVLVKFFQFHAAGNSLWDKEEDDGVSSGSEEEEELFGDLRVEYPVKLRRPPTRGAPLLLVSTKGVYSIHAGLTARWQDLMQQVLQDGINDGIPERQVRLRSRPRGALSAKGYIGNLLPHKENRVVCIYMHARLAHPHDDQDLNEVMWPERLAKGAMSGFGMAAMRVCAAFAFVFGYRATCSERISELLTCLCEACTLWWTGGSSRPTSTAQGYASESSGHLELVEVRNMDSSLVPVNSMPKRSSVPSPIHESW